jgi:hypothetical protein
MHIPGVEVFSALFIMLTEIGKANPSFQVSNKVERGSFLMQIL